MACGGTPCRNSKPASTRRSSAELSSASGLRTTAASSAVGKLAPNRGTDLRHLLGRTAEPVEPRHQGGVQGRRDRHCRPMELLQRCALACALALRFQHRLGHFLNEQWNAVGALDDVLSNVRREMLVASDPVDHRFDFAPREPIEGESGDMRLSDPRRLELGPKGYDQQDAAGRGPIHSPAEYLQTGGIGPMRILEDHQHRVFACKRLDRPTQRFKRFLPTLLRCQVECGITSVVWQR